MIFSEEGTTVIEFAMRPHVNRCFGFMSMALNMDYWLLPHISSSYASFYQVDAGGIDAMLRLVRQVIHRRRLQGILRDRTEL